MSSLKTDRCYWVDQQASLIGVKFQVAELYGVTVRKRHEELEKSKRRTLERVADVDIDAYPILQGYRDLFAAIGVTDAIASPEWLLRLVARNHQIPSINTVVDAYNQKSIERFVVASAHDLAKIRGDVRIVMTTGDEVFYPLGSIKGERLRAGEWAGVDDAHVLCRLNCKQSELSKVTFETTDLLIYVQGNKMTSDTYLQDSLVEICEHIIRFDGGEYYLLPERD